MALTLGMGYRGVKLWVEYSLKHDPDYINEVESIRTTHGDEVGPLVIWDKMDQIRFEQEVWEAHKKLYKEEYYQEAELEEMPL